MLVNADLSRAQMEIGLRRIMGGEVAPPDEISIIPFD